MKPNEEERILGMVKDLLDEEVENLDARTKRRLEQARMGALDAAGESRWGSFMRRRWLMFGSFATAATAAVAVFMWLHASPGVLPAGQIEDFEIITSQERMDFYENLDFYRWLAARENERTKGKPS
jgi:hypothetical protein